MRAIIFIQFIKSYDGWTLKTLMTRPSYSLITNRAELLHIRIHSPYLDSKDIVTRTTSVLLHVFKD